MAGRHRYVRPVPLNRWIPAKCAASRVRFHRRHRVLVRAKRMNRRHRRYPQCQRLSCRRKLLRRRNRSQPVCQNRSQLRWVQRPQPQRQAQRRRSHPRFAQHQALRRWQPTAVAAKPQACRRRSRLEQKAGRGRRPFPANHRRAACQILGPAKPEARALCRPVRNATVAPLAACP